MKIVLKLGGNAMDNVVERAFAEQVANLRTAGHNVAVVHGGGPQIGQKLQENGFESQFVAGLRVTSSEAIPFVCEAITAIQTSLVDVIESAVAVDPIDSEVFVCAKHLPIVDGGPVDIGQVGNVLHVNADAVSSTFDASQVPVVACLGIGNGKDDVFNINADTAAGALAAALHAHLVMVTNVAALYADWPNTDSRIAQLTTLEAAVMEPDLADGMRPKVEACRASVIGGALSAVMIGAEDLIRVGEIFEGEGPPRFGTRVVLHEREMGGALAERTNADIQDSANYAFKG